MDERCCGTCRFHRAYWQGEWYCNNQDAEYYTLETEYDTDACEEWEKR